VFVLSLSLTHSLFLFHTHTHRITSLEHIQSHKPLYDSPPNPLLNFLFLLGMLSRYAYVHVYAFSVGMSMCICVCVYICVCICNCSVRTSPLFFPLSLRMLNRYVYVCTYIYTHTRTLNRHNPHILPHNIYTMYRSNSHHVLSLSGFLSHKYICIHTYIHIHIHKRTHPTARWQYVDIWMYRWCVQLWSDCLCSTVGVLVR